MTSEHYVHIVFAVSGDMTICELITFVKRHMKAISENPCVVDIGYALEQIMYNVTIKFPISGELCTEEVLDKIHDIVKEISHDYYVREDELVWELTG